MSKPLCAWASIDERGKVAWGKAGDQTTKEVKTGPYYDFGQTLVLRCNNRIKALLIAKYAKAIAQNDLVGYDQTQRTTSYNLLRAANWNPLALNVPCEIDCSELAAVAVNIAYGEDLIPSGVYSGNIAKALLSTNEFTGYNKTKSPAMFINGMEAGDIFIREGHHVIVVVEDTATPVVDVPPVTCMSIHCLAFQKAYNLDHPTSKIKEDGIIGNEVIEAANTVCLKASYDAAKHTYGVGSKGHIVEFVQGILKSNQDGLYGRGTRALVIDWQTKNPRCGKPDGCVGPKTIISML